MKPTIFGGPSYPETIVLSYQRGMAKLDRDNEALRADLKAVATALDEWDYATKNPTPSGDRLACSESVLRAVFHRPGVQSMLEGAEDA